MSAQLTVEEIIPRLQLLRLNVMPPYVSDDDEGQRSDDEYISYYKVNIDDAVLVIASYIKTLEDLLENSSSEENIHRYLGARKAFINFFPFLEDELPDESSPEYQPAYEFLRSSFARKPLNTLSSWDLQKLREYQSLLTALQRVLPRP